MREGLDPEGLCHDVLCRVPEMVNNEFNPRRCYVTLSDCIRQLDRVVLLVHDTRNFGAVCAADTSTDGLFRNGNPFRYCYQDLHILLKVCWLECNSVVGRRLLLPIAWSHTCCLPVHRAHSRVDDLNTSCLGLDEVTRSCGYRELHRSICWPRRGWARHIRQQDFDDSSGWDRVLQEPPSRRRQLRVILIIIVIIINSRVRGPQL